MDVGGELRRARQARNLSIAQLSGITKINPHLLEAIENNDFTRLPGGLFTRGYLRAYAREVGLDLHDVVDRYRAEYEPPEMPDGDARAEKRRSYVGLELTSIDTSSGSYTASVVLAIAFIVGVVYLAAVRHPPATPASAPPSAVAAMGTPLAAAKPVATAGSIENRPIPATALKLEITAQGLCWVAATADNAPVFARLMNAGDRQTIEAHQALRLRVGDPSAFAFAINGVPGRTLGQAGVPVTVEITSRNYATLLDPRARPHAPDR